MAASLIVEIEVVDREQYAEYVARSSAVVEQHGRRYLARSDAIIPLSGDWHPERLILIEFPSLEASGRWATSPEYQELAPLRMRSTRTPSIAVEGSTPDVRAQGASAA